MKTAAALLLMGLFVAPWPASAEGQYALIIGNGAYRSAPALLNPPNDAADVAASMQRLGYSVDLITDADYEKMRQSLLSFSKQISNADFIVIYFAGHGMEVGGENWLIPIDAKLLSDFDIEQEAIGLKSMVLLASGAKKLGLVIVDACRNNPFATNMTRNFRTRSVERGLGKVEPLGSVLVAYSAKDGTTAADGNGRNSPFTTALLRNIEVPDLEINFLFRNVRDEVLKNTAGEQEPFVYGSLSSQAIYLSRTTMSIVAPAKHALTTPNADETAWSIVKGTNDPKQLRRFLEQFPNSPRRIGIESTIKELELKKTEIPTNSGKCIFFNGEQICD